MWVSHLYREMPPIRVQYPLLSFAQHLADELCMFDNVPESITRFFDLKAFARELFMSDYDMGDGGHVFRTC